MTGVQVGEMPAPAERREVNAGDEPSISGRIVTELRALMIAQGVWPKVRDTLAARNATALRWLDDAAREPWVDLDIHLALVDAAGEALGLQQVRELGRERMIQSSRAGIFAAIVRGWLRSFQGDPAQVLKVMPHLWRAGVRRGGSLRVLSSGEGRLDARLSPGPAATQLGKSAAWRALLEGFCVGLIDLCGATGEAAFEVSSETPGAVDLKLRWRR
jgi:hypothetical protein